MEFFHTFIFLKQGDKMQKLLNEKSELVNFLVNEKEVTNIFTEIETYPFIASTKKDKLKEVNKIVDKLINKGAVEKANNLKTNFVIKSMKKKPSAKIEKGDWDESYEIFRKEMFKDKENQTVLEPKTPLEIKPDGNYEENDDDDDEEDTGIK